MNRLQPNNVHQSDGIVTCCDGAVLARARFAHDQETLAGNDQLGMFDVVRLAVCQVNAERLEGTLLDVLENIFWAQHCEISVRRHKLARLISRIEKVKLSSA
jgi:hypothetical protein